MCRTVYLAWRAGIEGEFAATPADTWRQQASRAFAAELLAPATLLRQRYGKTGLDNVAVERLASEWQCPPQIIVHQAKNNKIAVKGVETAAYF
jgi:Zn-dependent peptidase ImmA (M78 family)